jgi:trans-aconitate methyltransferase
MDFDGFKIRTAVASAATCPRVTFQEGDLLHAEYPACDHVLMLDVLHYLPMDEKERVLVRAWNAMCPGGMLVLREAMSEDSRAHRRVRIFERWAVWLGQNRTAHGLHFATRETYENLLRKTGFAEIQFRADGGLGSNALLIARRGENLIFEAAGNRMDTQSEN